MKIGSHIIGIVAPVNAAAATQLEPPATGAIFGALLALGGHADAPATAEPAAPVPPSAPVPAASTATADITLPPFVAEAPTDGAETGVLLEIAAPFEAAPAAGPAKDAARPVTIAPSEPAVVPFTPVPAMPSATPLSAVIVTSVAVETPVAAAASAAPRPAIKTKPEADDPPADQIVVPSSPPPAMIGPAVPPPALPVTIAVSTVASAASAATVDKSRAQAGASALDAAPGTTLAIDLTASDGAPAQNAVPATRGHAFNELYKVHHASAAAAPVVVAQPGRIGREMGVEIARHVAAGRDEMTVRLDPPDLGRVDIRLSFDRDGAVRGVIAADSQSALDLLRKETGDLTRALADAGIRSDAQSFRFDSRARDFGHQQQRHAEDNGRESPAQPDTPLIEPPVYRALRASGRIDLMA